MNAQQIARSLTPAQKKAFLAMPIDREFEPLGYARNLPTIAVLRAKRLIRPVRDTLNPWTPNIITRPLGLAVRTALMEKTDAH